LKGIGTRVNREYLLESLIDPSAKIAEGFGLLNITLKSGDSLDGIQLKQTPTELTMRLVTGETKTIPTSQIQARSANSISAMPPMGEVLSPMELRDVIEFLATWK
jgi:putative heme-binding domain-containing protein